jgi:hypothetical protein
VGDRWTFVNVLPRSGLIHTVHHGKRTKEEAEQFVQTIKRHSDGEAPLFLSEGWQPYPDVLESTYSQEEPVPYAGRGRPKPPIRVVDAKLKYAQVIKHKQRGRLVGMEKRVLRGTEEEILDIIRTEQRGQTITTSYVERVAELMFNKFNGLYGAKTELVKHRYKENTRRTRTECYPGVLGCR